MQLLMQTLSTVSLVTAVPMIYMPAKINATHRLPLYIDKYGTPNITMPQEMLKKAFPPFINEHVFMRGFPEFMEKLSTGAVIRMMVMGGSMTKGNGCGRDLLECRWSMRVKKWLEAAYPRARIEYLNYAFGSSTSVLGLWWVLQQTLPVDVLLVDYSINDVSLADRPENLMRITENIVRKALNLSETTMIIYLFDDMLHPNVETAYRKVCDQYDVPVLSYTRAVYDEVLACQNVGWFGKHPQPINYSTPNLKIEYCRNPYSLLWDVPMYYPHPGSPTHQAIADTVIYFITYLTDVYQQRSLLPDKVTPPTTAKYNFPKEPLFTSSDLSENNKVDGSDFCETPLSSLTSLGSDDEPPDINATKLSFMPFDPSPEKSPFRSKPYYDGWGFHRDHVGKPKGWIAGTSLVHRNSHHNVSRAQIAFRIVTATGRISITYLSTYENAGMFEVFLGCEGYDSNGGIFKTQDPDLIGSFHRFRSFFSFVLIFLKFIRLLHGLR